MTIVVFLASLLGAMALGMPIAFAVNRLFNGDFSSRGVQIPVTAEFYEPLLQDLRGYGISFVETIEEI